MRNDKKAAQDTPGRPTCYLITVTCLRLRPQNHHVVLGNRQHKGVPLAEAQRFCPIFQAIHSPVKLLKLNALAVPVVYPLGIHEHREWRIFLNVAELWHDMALMVRVQIDHPRHFLHRTACCVLDVGDIVQDCLSP